MKKLIYIVLTLCLIMLNYSNCGRSGITLQMKHTQGCESEFYEKDCIYEVYCLSYVDFQYTMIPSNHYIQCKRTVSIDGHEYVPLRLHYKEPNSIEVPNNIDNYYGTKCGILDLNLSFNNYDTLPIIYEIPNLELLNVSYNNIVTAKFFNEFQLKSIKEIDFSYNKIARIIINENEFVYRGLKTLWLCHNQLGNLPDAIFNNFSELEYLDLSNNFIADVTIYTFEGIKKLKILKMAHNEIRDINSSLFRFNKLTELYLNHNKIENIFVRDFEKLNQLEILDLRNNSIVTLEKDVFNNLVLLKQIDLSENLLKVIDKNIFSTIINLKSIDLSKNELTKIPTYLFQGKNISFFSVEENSLQGPLKKGTFEGLQLNTRLDVSYQNITSVEDYAFFGLDNLIDLLLNNNAIRALSSKSFKTLRKLENLDLSHNQITHIDFDKKDLLSLRSLLYHNNQVTQIKSDNLHDLESLKFLDLSQNNITKIESQSFNTLVNVNNLMLNKNPITGNLEAHTFEGLASVPKIDLSYTFLNVLMNTSFDSMKNLYYLNISHSKVSELQYDTFSNTGNIEVLDLSYNEIRNFSVNATDLKNLKQLFLNNNLITVLYGDVFKGMSLLNKILLPGNQIKSVDDNTFNGQKELHYLDLSHNSNMELNFSTFKKVKFLQTLVLSGSVSNISFEEFGGSLLTNLDISHSNIQNVTKLCLSKLKKIQSLYLNHNGIKQLEVGAFSNMTEVGDIDISYNKINIIQPGVFKDNYLLNKLNISHNALLAVSYGVLSGLSSLRIFDISFNFIKSLEIERFHEVPDLEELIVDQNKIIDIHLEDFRETNIKKLSIGDNPLPCKIVTKLKKASHSSFVITALRHVEDKQENINGISCIDNFHEFSFNTKVNEKHRTDNNTENSLSEIRDILHNLIAGNNRREERVFQDEDLFKFTKSLQSAQLDNLNKWAQLSNETLAINEEQKTTNKLLERILKIVVATNTINRTLVVPVRDNITSDNFVNYINKIRQDFDNAMILDKEKILAEVENKISDINKRIESVVSTTSPALSLKNEKLTLNNESKSSVFLETCVAFILLILVCLVLYKVYKSRFYIPRRRSISTNPISDALDISNV